MNSKPKIYSDCHHEHLYESLRILFEDRLGYELYRAIGLEWYHEKFWNVYPHPATAQQYLGLHQGTPYIVNPDDDTTLETLNCDFVDTGNGLYTYLLAYISQFRL